MKAGERVSVPVTRRALLQRLNRRLAQRGEVLKSVRGAGAKHLGRYFLLNWQQTAVTGTNVDPEKLARSLGVLEPWEKVER